MELRVFEILTVVVLCLNFDEVKSELDCDLFCEKDCGQESSEAVQRDCIVAKAACPCGRVKYYPHHHGVGHHNNDHDPPASKDAPKTNNDSMKMDSATAIIIIVVVVLVAITGIIGGVIAWYRGCCHHKYTGTGRADSDSHPDPANSNPPNEATVEAPEDELKPTPSIYSNFGDIYGPPSELIIGRQRDWGKPYR